MLRILESQAPAKQTATDTIQTLCSRLSSATLLEDRRAAIQGLRSFAKLYPASVASGALRDLINGLRSDGEDSDTIKLVLETLLLLFDPDENSPEASEEITLWLADEFTQRQDNITALLDLLESSEFYLRLYALQILSHVSSARPQRTQEAVFAAPLGVSRITAVLDDKRDAVRNEALMLLVALTPTSPELQKVVAFENAFDRVFAMIESEGALTHGSTTVQDCLSLLANLLKLNTSNQSYFREIGGVKRIAKLLTDAITEEDSADGVSEWMKPQRDMNVWGLLTLIQLFLARGAQGTNMNQNAFWQSGVMQRVLQLGFKSSFSTGIRAKALDTCGDIIRANQRLQEQFGDFGVELQTPESTLTNGHTSPNSAGNATKDLTKNGSGYRAVNVIEALLELVLQPAPMVLFNVRLAACNCMKSFFEGHTGIRAHVLRRAIEGHRSGDDKIPNILTVLSELPAERSTSDPYQQWMAAVLLMHLLLEEPETKTMAMNVSEGDSDSGEEVVTFIQTIATNIITGAQRPEDERALLGYLMLLCLWLFEEPDAVNDFLGEGSNVQGLATAVKMTNSSMPLVSGLAALLLGIVYEFSTKDSPIPRTTLQNLLVSSLGRETYIDRLTKLRENVFVRDFEVLPQSSHGGLPDVYFDKTFIDFLKDNFSRLLRAIDRDPVFEVSIVSNGIQKGISRDLVDSLRAEVEEQKRALESANEELLQLRSRLEQEEMEHRRTRESTNVELGRIKQINQSLHSSHEEELDTLKQEHARERNMLLQKHEGEISKRRVEHSAALDAAQRQREQESAKTEQRLKQLDRESKDTIKKMIEQHKKEIDELENQSRRARERDEAEIADLKGTVEDLQKQVDKAGKDHILDLETAHDEYKSKTDSLQSRLSRAEERAQEAETRAKKHVEELETEKIARKDVQTELDDLLVVFSDLEAKRAADKAKLKDLGEEVSDDEDAEVEDGENDEDNEDSEHNSDVD